PDASGAEAVVRLREASPSLPIVVFSVDRTPVSIRSVLRAGANGYVTKDAPVARVVAALRGAASGLVVMGPEEAISVAGTVEMPSRGEHGGRRELPSVRGDASRRAEPGPTQRVDRGAGTAPAE